MSFCIAWKIDKDSVSKQTNIPKIIIKSSPLLFAFSVLLVEALLNKISVKTLSVEQIIVELFLV